jgi:hypothetical protein
LLRSRTTGDEGRSGARMGALPHHPETDFTDTPGPFWGFLFGTNDLTNDETTRRRRRRRDDDERL